MKKYITSLFCLAAVPFATGATVFLDTFADDDRTVDPAWFIIGAPAAVNIDQADGVLSLGRTQSNSHTYLASNWGGTSLAVGDSLAFSFRIKLTGNPGNRNNEIMFGIGNNNGTVPTADGENVFADDFGYVVALGTGSGTGSIQRDAGTDNWLGRSPGVDHTQITDFSSALAITGSFQTYTLTLTRTGDGLDIELSNGTTTITTSDANVPSDSFYTFNTVTFGYYNRNVDNFVDVDFVEVVYSAIPEPSAYAALFGLLALACVRFRRR